MKDDIDLVLVGYRPGLLHAASRMGLRVLLVEESAPTAAASRRIVAAVRAPLEGDQAALVRKTQAALGACVPRAVVSAGERGVLAAAAIRASYNLGGIGPDVARRARDKADMKTAARAAGIRCTDWATLDEHSTPEALVETLGLPMVLKHRRGSGTRGLMVAKTNADVKRSLASIPPAERIDWMAEAFVAGPEMSIESFVDGGEIKLVNPTEYYVTAFSNIAPAALTDNEAHEIYALNAAVLRALDLRRGMTHLELYRTADGPVFGEVAVRPPGGRIMRLLRRAYDFDPWEALIQLELRATDYEVPRRAIRTGGVWMFHPGAGRVLSVRGLAAARRVKGVRKLVCRVRAGQTLQARASTGSDIGWLEVWGKTRDQVAERMQRAYDLIQIEMAPVD